jgi:hypothetical protein
LDLKLDAQTGAILKVGNNFVADLDIETGH